MENNLEKALNQPQQSNENIIADPIVTALPLYVALERIRLELQKDKEPGSYYHTWQSNIAMCFYDAYRHRWTFPEDHGVLQSVRQLANQAAINFLEILCSQKDENIGLIRQAKS